MVLHMSGGYCIRSALMDLRVKSACVWKLEIAHPLCDMCDM
jgi:hypothetical protein